MKPFNSKLFINKDGKAFTTKPHYAHFNDTFNATRVRCFMVLYDRLYYKHESEGLSTSQLHQLSGGNYDYIKRKLAKWCEWGFLKRKIALVNNRPCYKYSIAERGRHFIEDIVPPLWLHRYAAMIRKNI